MPIRFNNKGYIRQPISNYIKTIQNELIPNLEQNIEGLTFIKNPIRVTTTSVTYNSDLKGDRALFEFSSNNSELDKFNDTNDPLVFLLVYYKSKTADVGVLNLSDINEASGLVYASLYDAGYRNSEDLAKDKADAEAKAAAELEEKRKAKEARAKVDDETLAAEKEDNKEEVSPEEELKNSLTDFNKNFDLYLKAMSDRGIMGSKMIAVISAGEAPKFKILTIELTFISSNICLVETNGINPKVNKTVQWNIAKNYITKVATKVNSPVELTAVDENGKDLELPEEDNFDVGINL